MLSDAEIAKVMLTFDEGDQRRIYDCGTGNPVFAEHGHLTGGIGHNFDARPLSDAVVELLFEEDLAIALHTCKKLFPDFDKLSQPRRLALINMAFNLGERKLSGFRHMVREVNDRRFPQASEAAKDSFWFIQVKARGPRVVKMFTDDEIPPEYLPREAS